MKAATTRKRTQKRGGPKKRRASTRQKVRRLSWFDRFLRTLPFSEDEIQRGFTWLVIAAAIILLFVAARWFGVFSLAHQQYAELAAQAGLEVKRVEITGMKRVDQLKVYDLVLAEKDRAMPLVDVEQIRKDLIGYGWIKDVRVSRRLPDMLVVEVIEREPSAVWQQGNKLSLIDKQGNVLENVPAKEAGNLPRIYGDGANVQIASFNRLLEEAPSLKPHVSSASWVGNRRWDISFKSGETLALPEGEQAAQKAILDFARMDGIHRLLGRDIIYFDLRDPDRAYLRRKAKTPPAPNEDTQGSAGKKGKTA
ncbi:MAG: cell division protein FtsQ/DivIB [Sphingorhabdus sp.]